MHGDAAIRIRRKVKRFAVGWCCRWGDRGRGGDGRGWAALIK